MQQILNPDRSRILTSYVPGQDNTVVVPTTEGTAWINMSRADIIKESEVQGNVALSKDRLCIGTPLKDITIEAHYQANYLNGFVVNKLNKVQVITSFLWYCMQCFLIPINTYLRIL